LEIARAALANGDQVVATVRKNAGEVHDSTYINLVLSSLDKKYYWLTNRCCGPHTDLKYLRDTLLPVIESGIINLASEQRVNTYLRTHSVAAKYIDTYLKKLVDFQIGMQSDIAYVGVVKAFTHMVRYALYPIPTGAVECDRDILFIEKFPLFEE
jgi:hypothetical protein